MFSAILAASRSSCIHLKTGAVLVKDKRIIATGYNGAPPGIENCLEKGCRKDREKVDFDDKGKGVCRGLHAEINALNQISRWELKNEYSILYSLYFPCSSCAKAIVGYGISEVIFSKYYDETDSLTKELFGEGGVKLKQLDIAINKIISIIKKVY